MLKYTYTYRGDSENSQMARREFKSALSDHVEAKEQVKRTAARFIL